MSDTQNQLRAAEMPKPIPGFLTEPATYGRGEDAIDAVRIKFGIAKPRTILLRAPNVGDQFDLLEIGGEAAGNELWMGMALVACTVLEIDGVPTAPGAMKKTTLRQIITRLGPVGMRAASQGIASMGSTDPDSDNVLVTAKN